MANNGQLSRSNERNLNVHRMPNSSMSTNRGDKDLVSLHNPRPQTSRDSNDYFDVNQPKFKSENVLTSSTSTNARTSALRLHSTTNFDPCRRSSSADRERIYKRNDSWNTSSQFKNFDQVQIHSKLPSSSISLPHTSTKRTLINEKSSQNDLNVIVGPGRPVRLVSKSDCNISHSIITSQPQRKSRDILNDNVVVRNGNRSKTTPTSSNMCPQCNKCRCTDCTTSKTIPSKWICANSYLCSLDTTVDLLSCMCCVKGCLYHTMGDDEQQNDDVSCSNDVETKQKCSSNCCLRWTIAGVAASFVMPCLLCYYPLKCCGKTMNVAYARYHDYGCRCVERRPGIVDGGRQLTRSSSNVLPPPFPELNFTEQRTKLTSGCGGVVEAKRQLFTVHKPP